MKQTIFDVFFNFHNEYEAEVIIKKANEFLELYPAFNVYVSVNELVEDTINRV